MTFHDFLKVFPITPMFSVWEWWVFKTYAGQGHEQIVTMVALIVKQLLCEQLVPGTVFPSKASQQLPGFCCFPEDH
jgi:hypothetical protein